MQNKTGFCSKLKNIRLCKLGFWPLCGPLHTPDVWFATRWQNQEGTDVPRWRRPSVLAAWVDCATVCPRYEFCLSVLSGRSVCVCAHARVCVWWNIEHSCFFQAAEGALPHEFMEGVEGVAGGFIYTIQGKLAGWKLKSILNLMYLVSLYTRT